MLASLLQLYISASLHWLRHMMVFFPLLTESDCYPTICWPNGEGCPNGYIGCPYPCTDDAHCCWYEVDFLCFSYCHRLKI